MNVLIVFTHPNSSSFNHAILERISAGLKEAGHTIKVKDLYQENFDPILSANDLEQLQQGKTPPKIAKEQEQLLWADSLIFIYPLWWFGRPAMLKGWFDIVMTNGLAFEYSSDGAKGLLKHERALVLITAGGSKQYFEDSDALQLIHRPITDGTLSFCGIKDVSHEIYYDIANISDEERTKITRRCRRNGEKFLNQEDSILHHRIYPGETPEAEKQLPLIILHGLFGSMDNWRSQAKNLSAKRPHTSISLKFDLLGHSMGGKVAMQMALAQEELKQDLVNRLIVVDIAPRPYPLWHQATLKAVLGAPVETFESRQEIDDHLKESIDDAVERAFMIKNLRRAKLDIDGSDKGFRWKSDVQEIAKGYLKIAGFTTSGQTFLNETLFIDGKDSRYMREQDHPIIEALFPNSTDYHCRR
ncbi:putative NAD(P)H oxidoreductase [Nymphon striatum]|nr:putative NAD(P)H oxidoreductase [Nymphon striatum]